MISSTELRPARYAAPVSRASAAGFTLIEVIVTLAVLSLTLALIVGHKPPWSSALGLRGTAAELASGLRLARSEAILHNRPVTFELDLAGHRYRVGTRTARQLPERLRIALLTIDGEQRNGNTGDIRFNPDGSSTGGRITIGDGAQSMAVGVEWISGRVGIANMPQGTR
jgi:general secretion pathway protein H